MVHGFPESWYSWRHQIGPIAEAGFTACAIDVRGYNGSQKFPEVADYSMEAIVRDVAGVARALSPDRGAILIGHDWGAPIVYNSALIHPEIFKAVAALSVVYTGVPARSFDDIIKEMFDDKNHFFYQSYFREVGKAEAVFDANPRDFLRRFYFAISGDVKPGSWPMDKDSSATLLEGLEDPEGLPGLADRRRPRLLRARVRAVRLLRPAQPLSQPHARLRVSAAVQGPEDRAAGLLHRRRPRRGVQHVRRGRPIRSR